jgi:hypothetical protein
MTAPPQTRKPVVVHLPMADETIDRLTRFRLEKNDRRWRWELDDANLSDMVRGLPKEAHEALVAARQRVYDAERERVVAMLHDLEALGRVITEEMEEQ